jgi:hypothetical protein
MYIVTIYFDVYFKNMPMFEMYNTPLNIMYLVLSVGFGLLVIFLIISLVYLIRILRDVNKITDKTKDTLNLVNHYLWQPIKIMMMILEKTKDFTEKRAKKSKN